MTREVTHRKDEDGQAYHAQVWTGDRWRTLGTYRTAGYARRRLAIWDRHEGRTSRWRCQETRVVVIGTGG